MKRGRDGAQVVLNVGGQTFTTTRLTMERSSYLASLLDVDESSSVEQTATIFIDRDPSVFAHILRLMRTIPIVAGLLPRDDPSLFAQLLAEADFFGFEALLRHVKATTYFHSRTVDEDQNDYTDYLPENYREMVDVTQRADARKVAVHKSREHNTQVANAFASKDEEYGADRFDEVFGSIATTLASGLLPSNYFTPPKATARILQLLPVESTTWYLLGDAFDDKYTTIEGARYPAQDDAMKPMERIIEQPALVRRVACHALVENEKGDRWVEPMLYIAADDQQEWMNYQPEDIIISSRDNTLLDPTCSKQTGGLSKRMLRAEEYLALIFKKYALDEWNIRRHHCWTHLMVRDQPPEEMGFANAQKVAEREAMNAAEAAEFGDN